MDLDLEAELETLKTELEKSKKDYSYLYADFDNYKKLKEQDLLNAKMKSRAEVIKHLIELYEDLNRVVNHSEDMGDSIETVIKKLKQIFKSESVELIEVKIGEKWDPSLHRVVKEILTPDGGTDIIYKEIKKGYKISGNVFQFCDVEISQSKSNTKEENVNVRN